MNGRILVTRGPAGVKLIASLVASQIAMHQRPVVWDPRSALPCICLGRPAGQWVRSAGPHTWCVFLMTSIFRQGSHASHNTRVYDMRCAAVEK